MLQSAVSLTSACAMLALAFVARAALRPRPPRPRPEVAEAHPILFGVQEGEAGLEPSAEGAVELPALVSPVVVQGQRVGAQAPT